MRERKGLTQRQVGLALGLKSPQFISNIENGQSALPISMVAALSVLYAEKISAIERVLFNIVKDEFARKMKTVKVTNKLRAEIKKKLQ